jgi:multisubunit Na+/H+ antiporter MnhC subunit
MNPALVAIVLAICAGAVVAVSTREPGIAPIGLAVCLVSAAVLADPLPSASILGVRVTAALLAATLIRWGSHGGARQLSPLGWPAEALLATSGAVAGIGIATGLAAIVAANGLVPGSFEGPGVAGGDGGGAAGLLGSGDLTAMALFIGAGTALLVLGAAPMVHGRPGIRRAIGLVLVAQAVLLLRVGIAGAAGDLEEVARASLLVACAATGAALARAAAKHETSIVSEGEPPLDLRHLPFSR